MTTDVASCSALGGALLTASARVGELAVEVQHGQRVLTRLAAPAEVSTRTRAEGEALEQAADGLAELGSALQAYATETAELQAAQRGLAEDARRWGLELVGDRLVDHWAGGPEPRERQEARRALEHRASTVARLERSRQRHLGRVVRAGGSLSAVTSRARERD